MYGHSAVFGFINKLEYSLVQAQEPETRTWSETARKKQLPSAKTYTDPSLQINVHVTICNRRLAS